MANGELQRLDSCSIEFDIQCINEEEFFTLEDAQVVPWLPDLGGSIPSAEDVAKNLHVTGNGISAGASMVQVIIGKFFPNLHVFSEIHQDGESRLWAGKSPLGWILHG